MSWQRNIGTLNWIKMPVVINTWEGGAVKPHRAASYFEEKKNKKSHSVITKKNKNIC